MNLNFGVLASVTVVFALAAVAVIVWFRRNIAKRLMRRNTCPKCLSLSTMKPDERRESDPGSSVEYLRCQNVISENPYDECGFIIPAYYRDYAKVAFTLLGTPAAGKTLWTAMIFRQISQGRYSSDVEFSQLKDGGADRYSRIADEVLNSRISPAATQVRSFPDPLVLEFRDRNRRKHCLVNLFDFAGEVTMRVDDRTALRRRQLRAEGYLFFLDPTQKADQQADALNSFFMSARIVRKTSPHASIDTPLAICLTKLDLLVLQPYYEVGGRVDQFFERLREIDPSGKSLSDDIIETRSKLTQELLSCIWPGWQILRQAESYFGRRWKLFPLTPIGINDLTAVDSHDLTQRMIDPYGTCEPLLWLLQQNGMSVFT